MNKILIKLILIKKKTYSERAPAKLSEFTLSKFVVGSSNARIPQFLLNVSANAILIIKQART